MMPVAPQLKFFKELLPTLHKLGIIYNPGEVNSVILLEDIKKEAKPLGMEIVALAVNCTRLLQRR